MSEAEHDRAFDEQATAQEAAELASSTPEGERMAS
jgi:hypothetical protein